MGTPDFAVGSLRALVDGGYNIVGVVTAPDKPAGRGQLLRSSAVKNYTEQLNDLTDTISIPILQPEKLRDEVFLSELRNLKADLMIVVAFRMLPEVVWAMPPLGTFNLHASLLPNYRGAAPINWAIINGEKKSGVTTFLLNQEIDCGAIIAQKECEIFPMDSAQDLHDRLMNIGATLVCSTVDMLASGDLLTKAQGDVCSLDIKPAPKLYKEDMELIFDDETKVEDLRNKIRGLSPYPAAWCKINSPKLPDGTLKSDITAKIFTAHSQCEVHGECVGLWQSDLKTYIRVALCDGWLYIDELQPQNKKRMRVADFLRGWR